MIRPLSAAAILALLGGGIPLLGCGGPMPVQETDPASQEEAADAVACGDSFLGGLRLEDDVAIAVDVQSEPQGGEKPGVEGATARIVTLTVLDDVGHAVTDAIVYRNAPPAPATPRVRRGYFSGSTDEFGRLEVPLDNGTGRSRLFVRAEGFAYWQDENWLPRDAVIRLDRPRTIEGTVRSAAGELLVEGVVSWTTSQGVRGETHVRPDGRFDVGGLPPSAVTLSWRVHRDSEPEAKNRCSVGPEESEFTFVVDPGPRLRVWIAGWGDAPARTAILTLETPAPGAAPRIEATVGSDGMVEFPGLRDGALYTLWVPPECSPSHRLPRTDDDWIVYRAHVAAAAEPLTATFEHGRVVEAIVDASDVIHDPEEVWEPDVCVCVRGEGWDRLAFPDKCDQGPGEREWTVRIAGVPAVPGNLVAELTPFGHCDPTCRSKAGLPAAGEGPIRIRLRPASAKDAASR